MLFQHAENITDTLKTAAQPAASQDTGWIMHHILDSKQLDFPPFGTIHLPTLHLLGYDISITKHVVFLWVAAILLITVLTIVSRSYKKSLVPKGVSNLMEVLIVL